jgi:hypothetical protein
MITSHLLSTAVNAPQPFENPSATKKPHLHTRSPENKAVNKQVETKLFEEEKLPSGIHQSEKLHGSYGI